MFIDGLALLNYPCVRSFFIFNALKNPQKHTHPLLLPQPFKFQVARGICNTPYSMYVHTYACICLLLAAFIFFLLFKYIVYIFCSSKCVWCWWRRRLNGCRSACYVQHNRNSGTYFGGSKINSLVLHVVVLWITSARIWFWCSTTEFREHLFP